MPRSPQLHYAIGPTFLPGSEADSETAQVGTLKRVQTDTVRPTGVQQCSVILPVRAHQRHVTRAARGHQGLGGTIDPRLVVRKSPPDCRAKLQIHNK